jgi:hypothetical protein
MVSHLYPVFELQALILSLPAIRRFRARIQRFLQIDDGRWNAFGRSTIVQQPRYRMGKHSTWMLDSHLHSYPVSLPLYTV